MPKNIPGLLDEHPLMVYPTLAKEIGINKAVMLQQLHFLINVTEAAKNVDHFIDGSWWVYNSYPQWKDDQFPWMGESTIKRFFLELEADGIVKSRQGIKSPTDRRKWYTIDYNRWHDYATMHRMIDASPSAQNEPVISSKRANGGLAQNEPVNGSKKSHVIGTETTTEATAEKKDSAADAAPKPRKRSKKVTIPAEQINPMKDAIHAAFKYPTWAEMTTNEKGKVNAAAKQLCAAGKTPGDVPIIYKFCAGKYDNFTPLALASHANEALRSKNASSCSPPHQHIHKAPERLPATNIVSDDEFKAARQKFEAEVFGDTSA